MAHTKQPTPRIAQRITRGYSKRVLTAALVAATLHLSAAPAWHQENGFRWAELPVPTLGKTGFTLLLPEETGIYFTNSLDERTLEANSRILSNGSGVAVGDFDNDGLPDIYFCSLNGHNALYKNLGGLKFRDVTKESGIVCSNRFCTGAVFSDINGDGYLDLLVASIGAGVQCFLNDGQGHFSDATVAAGTASKYGSMTVTLADIDGNGNLDLYVANYRTEDIRDKGQVDLQMVNGKLTVPPALRNRFVLIDGKFYEYGEPDILYLNDGKGHFTPVSWTNGAFLDETGKTLTNAPLDWGLTATFRDLNGDGWPDIYVCNDYWTPDRIWMNDGRGHFRAANNFAFRHTSASSMGVDCADLTRSGRVDLFVADMLSRDLRLRKRQMPTRDPVVARLGEIDNRPQIVRNTLFANRGDGTFAEIGDFAGVAGSDWSSSPVFIDVDLDGYPDLLIAAGHVKDVQDLDAESQIRSRLRSRRGQDVAANGSIDADTILQLRIENSRLYPPLDMPIVAYQNIGDYRFAETTALWGTGNAGVHQGLALGDLDGDGDLDLIVNNFSSAAGIYRNETAAPRVAVQLKGSPPNTKGIGAKVTLLGGTVPTQSQEVISGGRFMAGSDTLAVFAPGKVKDQMTLEVRWRDGKRSVVNGVKANRIYEIDESGVQAFTEAPQSPPKPLFEDESRLLAHIHHEEEFNDFERQPLLPRKLSQLGPGLAWADVDGDGWEDLIIGSGKGGRMAIYRNNHQSGFNLLTNFGCDQIQARDQAGIVTFRRVGGGLAVLAGSANYEDGPSVGSGVLEYGAQSNATSLPIAETSIGPLAITDLTGNGNLELFVGGRVIPGRYPEAASSHLFSRRGDQWRVDEQNTKIVEKAGLVSGAVWSDLDGDGFPDLVLACEWGPVRVFKNEAGKLREITSELGLSEFIGWWNGVTTGDMDGSGRMAIIASNWGLNTPYHATKDHPVALFYGDFANRGTIDLIEADYDPVSRCLAPRRMRDRVAAALPDLPLRFPTQKAFSEASMAQVLGDRQPLAHKLTANTLASTVFWNHGKTFEAQPLPMEAQFAPTFSLNVADFDGDGREDLFLSQNFFANQPEVPRYDAGRGLLLRGDGAGGFRPLPGQDSGIKIYGEQRGAAAADFDNDGRVDLAVSQNGAATMLFHNVGARPGLRVRLVGPNGNPDGIGAQIRLLFGTRGGPVREIHCGSGYWSQDSSVQVMAIPERPTRLWVRWPGGKITTTDLLDNPKEISVDYEGKLVH